MPAPFEVMAGAFTVWLNVDGTLEPLKLNIDPTTETVPWELFGKYGSKSYDEDGFTMGFSDSRSKFRGLGGTGVRKQWRTEEDVTFKVKVLDATPEHVAKVVGSTLITRTASASSSAGKAAPLKRGQLVPTFAFLARTDGGGPYSDAQKAQFWVPRCSIGDIGEWKTDKGTPLGSEITFEAWEHETLGFGNYFAASANPTP